MAAKVPEGFRAISPLPRGIAERSVDRALRTTDDAMRFVDAVFETMGPRAWSDPWVRPGGDRRLYAVDPARPGWVISPSAIELVLDVPPPPPWANQIVERDGTVREIQDDRPRPQPEGPNQRSAHLRLIDGVRIAQWTYDESGRARERARGRGAGTDAALPFLHDLAGPDPDPQRPHPVFLRDDLEPDGLSPRELAERVAALDLRASSTVRVHAPVPMPGGPALCARRVIWELVRDGLRGRWGYPGEGWVIADGYLGEVRATGATFDAALAAWRDAVRLANPVPRDSRSTPEDEERDRRAFERAVEEAAADVGPDGVPRRMVIRFEPPVKMPFPPRRPECCPAVAIPLPAAPELPASWRAAGYGPAVRLIGEDGRCGHAFVRAEPDGTWRAVGAPIVARLDPAALEAELAAADRAAEARDAAFGFGPPPRDERRPAWAWRLQEYAPGRDGRLMRAGSTSTSQPPDVLPDPQAEDRVLCCRRLRETPP